MKWRDLPHIFPGKDAASSDRLGVVCGSRSKYSEPPASIPAAPRVRPMARYGSGQVGHAVAALRSVIGRSVRPMQFWVYTRSRMGRDSLATLDKLRNSQAGETGVIVCNGPSINRTDLSLISDLPHILMNRGYLLSDHFSRPPAATCSHDPAILANFGSEIAQTESVVITTFAARRQVKRESNTVYLMPSSKWLFAERLGLDTHHGGTVTFWALELAYLLGWTKTIIVGLDHRYAQQAVKQGGVRVAGQSDSDHFVPNYLPRGTKYIVNDLALSEYSFALAKAAFDIAGRDLVDCTVGGACEVFRKGDLAAELASDSIQSSSSPNGCDAGPVRD